MALLALKEQVVWWFRTRWWVVHGYWIREECSRHCILYRSTESSEWMKECGTKGYSLHYEWSSRNHHHRHIVPRIAFASRLNVISTCCRCCCLNAVRFQVLWVGKLSSSCYVRDFVDVVWVIKRCRSNRAHHRVWTLILCDWYEKYPLVFGI